MAGNDTLAAVLEQFGRKYLWWDPVGAPHFSDDRIIAQTMNFGTYDDILVLEQTIGKPQLVDIMRRAEPGWFNDRSWEFWRGRLSRTTSEVIPNQPPRRKFDGAAP